MTTLDINVFITKKAYNNYGSSPLDIAVDYLFQALPHAIDCDNEFDSFNLSASTKSEDIYDAGDDDCINPRNIEDWVINESSLDVAKDSNHVIADTNDCSGSSIWGGSWSSNARDLALLDYLTSGTQNSQLANDQSHAVTSVLHEVGHNILDDSLNQKESHKIGANWIDDGEYYVTPMLTSYDRSFVGEELLCDNYCEDPDTGERIILEHYWDDCTCESFKRN